MEDIITAVFQTIINFATKFYFLVLLLVFTWLIVTFRLRIDYLFMKNDLVWRKWYKAVFRCPRCHRKLRPADYPPNYCCPKCSNTFTFGDKDVKEWIRHKPALTKGEFFRYLTLLAFLGLGALWVFTSGVIKAF